MSHNPQRPGSGPARPEGSDWSRTSTPSARPRGATGSSVHSEPGPASGGTWPQQGGLRPGGAHETPRARHSRRPVRITPSRTAGDVFAGFGALLALVGLVGGVPYALIRLAGPPLPEQLMDAELLTSQVGPETIVAILVLLVWLAWSQLFVCVIVEVYAGIRRIGMPARVPLSGGTQALANRLVSAVLVLFTATAVAVPVASMGATPPLRPQMTAMSALSAPVAPALEERAPLHVHEVKKVYVVQPPHGRHHESLWEIADKCLGDGRRYPEIYRLNQHKEQPDGSRLQIADLIRPGWVLDMPHDARNVHVVSVDQDRPAILDDHRGKPPELDGGTQFIGQASTLEGGDALADPRPERSDAVSGREIPLGAEGVDDLRDIPGDVRGGDRMDVRDVSRDGASSGSGEEALSVGDGGAGGTREGSTGPRHGESAGGQVTDSHSDASKNEEDGSPGGSQEGSPSGSREGAPEGRSEGSLDADTRAGEGLSVTPAVAEPEEAAAELGLMDFLAGASLAAAGLLAVLGRRRREQLWRRAFGRRVVRPRGDAAHAEVAIRLGADAPGSRMLDIGLRLLGKLLAEEGRRPPTIYAVHLSSRGLDLWIHPSDLDAPEPWESRDAGRVWRLSAHKGRRIDEQALADVAAPYPGLVSLGTTGGGRVLVDLEAAHGLICMAGAHTVAALSALAVELATNHWSDRMRITLVGFGEELALLAPDRIRIAGSLAEALPDLEKHGRDRKDDVLTGRIHSRAADPAGTPHYLLSAIRPDENETRRLAMLGKGIRAAAGYVVAGEVPHATWTWEITEDGRARIDALGFEVDAHLLPRRHYNAVIDLFRTAQRVDGEPMSELTMSELTISEDSPSESGMPERAERMHDEPPSIEVRVLGPIEISPVNPLEEGRDALAHELVVYLATHPGGVHPVVLSGVLWPRGVQPSVRDATISRVAEWLGVDSEGRPNLFVDDSGRLRLGPEVRADWQVFQGLIRRSREIAGSGRSGEAEAVLLEKALGFVRGPLLNGRPTNRYAWLAADSLEYDVTACVADAAHRLCELRLAQGAAGAAVAAARVGLLLAPDDEGLWRDLLRSAHIAGDSARLRAIVDGLRRRASSHPYGGGMAPETEALIDELLPAWRRSDPPDLRAPRLA